MSLQSRQKLAPAKILWGRITLPNSGRRWKPAGPQFLVADPSIPRGGTNPAPFLMGRVRFQVSFGVRPMVTTSAARLASMTVMRPKTRRASVRKDENEGG